ncbi:DegT/DnrJ/EryC1/StrS family aminotransferase [Halobium salinum]|uniref:DegT/DnrJ/EryC1/StrS family aminotransferase n=1 Tax=Halobium salinum TaxID=1364940 RepID=A0ABD5PCT4_9EURY|nr:DegT/DnrJ/EryC1/StrS family aminotransferase [Halobium salinum]
MTEPVPFTDVYVDDDIVERVGDVLEGKRWVKGPETEAFEDEFAAECGVDHAVGVNSGTAALLLAMKAVGVGEGDTVLVPAHTFFATVSPALELGAEPVFVDADPDTYGMDPDDLARKAEGRDVTAVVPVHLYGQPTAMGEIRAVADEHDAAVVEDACQAHFATYDGDAAGSLGDVGCFSFYPSKNMTVGGDGGMLVTDDDDLAAAARELRNHGRNPEGEHVRLGLNWRLDEIKAAVGREQLGHIHEWNAGRREAAGWYEARLADVDEVETPVVRDDAEHVYHLYVVQVPDRDALREKLESKDIGTGIHYATPAHRHEAVAPYVDEANADAPEAERLVDRILSLPMHPRITEAEVERVCDVVEAHYADAEGTEPTEPVPDGGER